MERPKRPCSIHSRPTKRRNHSVYYVQFRDETGACDAAVSTGCTRRDDAVRWCETRLKDNRERREKVTFAEYGDGFWCPEAPFARDRTAHGRTVSSGYLDCCTGALTSPLLPSTRSYSACRRCLIEPSSKDTYPRTLPLL
jgi:hypothetical protein